LGEVRPELLTPPLFVINFLPCRNSLKMSDERRAVGHEAGAHTAFGNGSEQLLGAPAADAEQRLHSRLIDPVVGVEGKPPLPTGPLP
jgi:hypothetical protein